MCREVFPIEGVPSAPSSCSFVKLPGKLEVTAPLGAKASTKGIGALVTWNLFTMPASDGSVMRTTTESVRAANALAAPLKTSPRAIVFADRPGGKRK